MSLITDNVRALSPGFLALFASLSLAGTAILPAQETQPTPFTALVDFSLYRHPATQHLPKPGLPIWLESVQIVPQENLSDGSLQTTFRFRLRPAPDLHRAVLLRLMFDDVPDKAPVVSAWTETGEQKYLSPLLGQGLRLTVTESLAIPIEGVDLIEIEVPGDGANLRQALLASLRLDPVASAFDFERAEPLNDPFGQAPSGPNREEAEALADTFLFGRVRALLDPGPVKLSPPPLLPSEDEPEDFVTLAFTLEAVPLLAVISLELLHADPTAALKVFINDQPAGEVAMQLPDLADPAYQGESRPLQRMRFHYTGWVRAQKAIRGNALRAGENTITFQLPAGASPVVLRQVELQLKNHWQKLDYILIP